MYRTALRAARRPLNGSQIATKLSNRRFASTGPASKGTWKGTLMRWGLAGAAVYFYSTSTMFREEPASKTIPPPPSFSDDDSKTVEAVIAEKRKQAELKALVRKREEEARAEEAEAQSGEAPVDGVPAEGGMETLEGEAESNGAFDPETGEINWDCPCLGGMAHGPCGEEFKAAFSCFVYSDAEPKGIDCVDKFQGMQECFRQHPDVYGAEIDDMDGDDSTAPAEGEQQHIEEGAKQEPGSVKPEPEASKAATPSTEKPKPSKQQSAEEEARQEDTETAKSEPEVSKAPPLAEQPKQTKQSKKKSSA